MTMSRSLLVALPLMLAAACPLAAQELDLSSDAALSQGSDDVRRFCANIADAARDRRYAIQAEELTRLQADVDARIEALEAKRAEYEEWLRRREEFLDRAEDSVVEIYARMRPDAAAQRMSELRPDLAAGILMKLNARQAGGILNEMESKKAAALTSVIASTARPEDPS